MRQNCEYIDALRLNPLFQGYDRAEMEDLLCDANARPVRFARGQLILGPDSSERALGFVLSGTARVARPCLDGGKPVVMSRLARGDAFGMATLFGEGTPFPNEIRASAESEVLFLSRQWVESALARDFRLARNYIALLSSRILFLNRRIDTFTADDAVRRLRGMLLEFQRAQGGRDVFLLPCSFTQLSSLLDVGRASLYRALEQLEKEGMFTREGRVFTLLSPQDTQTHMKKEKQS